MKKEGLSNDLLGRTVSCRKGTEHLWPDIEEKWGVIVAAWTEKQNDNSVVVKVSARLPNGQVCEFYLTHVRLSEKQGA